MSAPQFNGMVERWEAVSRYHPLSGFHVRFDIRFATKEEADRFYDCVVANVGLSSVPPKGV